MRRTAILLTATAVILAGCWEDETAEEGQSGESTTEQGTATAALEGELPVAPTAEQLALNDALVLTEEARAALIAQRLVLEDEIARLRANAASFASDLQSTAKNTAARDAAIQAELAAQQAEQNLAALQTQLPEDVQTNVAPPRLQPYLGAWAERAMATSPDWVIGPDFLIWRDGACTITPTDVTARFALSNCQGNAVVEIVDLRIADDVLTVIANGREFVLNEIVIR